MPCSDSSSRMVVRLDAGERIRSVDFDKVTCGKPIGGASLLSDYCSGRPLAEIAGADGGEICTALGMVDDEDRFLFQLEWVALQAALGRYTGDDEEIDTDRYQVSSIVHDSDGVVISLVVAPPGDLPPITPCSKSKS